MNFKQLTVFLLTLFISIQAFSQVDPKAKKILDEVSSTTKLHKTIQADFTFKNEHKDKKVSEIQEGSISIKGEKFKLSISGQDIISDSKTTWTYLKDANEVQINNTVINPDEVSPTTIFTIYEKGFKSKFDKEETTGGKTYELITLFPNEPEKKPYHTVKLKIDKAAKQISELKVMSKDGSVKTYTVKKFTPNLDLPDNTFTFDLKKYPGIEVVDLRE